MARGEIAVWIGVESVADSAGVAGAYGSREVAVGGDITFGDHANEFVNLLEKVHIN